MFLTWFLFTFSLFTIFKHPFIFDVFNVVLLFIIFKHPLTLMFLMWLFYLNYFICLWYVLSYVFFLLVQWDHAAW